MSIVIFGKFATLSDRKKIQNFLDKPINFILKKTQIVIVLRCFFFNSVAFHSKYANFGGFFKKNSQFVSKNRFNVFKKSQFLSVLRFDRLRVFTFSIVSYGKYATFSAFQRNQLFSEKPIYISFEKNPSLERSKEFFKLSRILRQLCELWLF